MASRSLRLPDELWEDLAEMARAERRTLSAYVRNVLEDHLAAKRSRK